MSIPEPNERSAAETRRLLRGLEEGDREAEERLLARLFQELRGIAAGYLADERVGHTLQPTALVHEAWLRLGEAGRSAESSWQDRRHFLRTAARAMRRVLVDHARARGAAKRGVRTELPPEALDAMVAGFAEQSIDVLALHDALERLAVFDEPLAQLVELRFFAGLSVPETARALERSVSTVERQWRLARAWLRRELGGIPEPEGSGGPVGPVSPSGSGGPGRSSDAAS